ncbi:hypothetical protein M3Y99_00210700 [Aphelenchoides fujianensis]|nr:hypothetical protein M3Y99_00210700 [Aphelenchoides fujianensis]
MTSNSATAQSFNPSWMQASAKAPKPNGTSSSSLQRHSANDDPAESTEMIDPIFAKHRYGREDLLALIRASKPSEGLDQCPFYIETPLTPITLTPLNETELRLQQNINSSKALSAAHRNDWQSKENTDGGGGSGFSSNQWTIAGARSNNSSSFRTSTNNRWTAPGAGSKGGIRAKEPPNRSEFGESFSKTPPERDITRRAEVPPTQPPAQQPPQQQQPTPTPIQKPNPIKPPTPKAEEPPKPQEWFYLDPQQVRRGPFEPHQMQAWFQSGYFHAELQIMPPGESSYKPLGDLIRQNGALTPFVSKAKPREQKASPPAPNVQPAASSASSMQHSAWSQPPAPQAAKQEAPAADASELSLESLKLIEAKERMIAEEQRKLREKEENLRREELEKEKRIQELQLELQRQKEEMEQRTRAKEEELERKRLQILEYERQQREKLEKLKAEREQQLAQEEMNRRAQAELEFARREQERQRELMEAELRKKEEHQRALKEKERQAEEQRRRLEEIEAQRRRQLEEQQRQKMREEAELQQKQMRERLHKEEQERLRRKQQEEEIVRQQQAAALLLAQQQAAMNKPAPWVGAGKANAAADLSQIQAQERAEMERKLQKMEEERRQLEAAHQKKTVWGAPANSQANGSPWNLKQAAKPAPIIPPTKKEPPAAKNAPKQKNKPAAKESTSAGKSQDPFATWLTQRIRQLNNTLDPEVLSTFLQSIESPNELEDYILSYFGETKEAKEFHQEFLAKRIELRPRRQRVTEKDDLSASAAATDISGHTSGSGAVGSANGGSGAAKKNKKSKGKQVVDILGFKPAGDPNRFNAGELDLDFSVASTRGKRK